MNTEIPLFKGSVEVEAHGSSAWARSYRISVQSTNGDTDIYFMKASMFPGSNSLRDHVLGCHI